MPQDIFDKLSTSSGSGDIFDKIAPAKPTPAPIVEPDLFGGFLSEAKKNAAKLGGILMNTMPGASTGMEATNSPKLDWVRSALGGGVPGGAGAVRGIGVTNMLKESPAGQAVQSIADLAKSGLQKTGIINPELSPAQQIEQKLAPSSSFGKQKTIDVAPVLAEDQGLLDAPKGLAFDRTLFNRFKSAGADVKFAKAQIPAETPVDTRFISTKFDDLIEQFNNTGAEDAVRALKNQQKRVLQFGDQMPWEQYSQFQTRFGNDLKRSGVWKRLANDTATEKDYALAAAYGQFMETTEGIGGDLGKNLAGANQKFSKLYDAINAAGLDVDTGRRIANIGTPLPPSLATRAGRLAVKSAIPAGLGYELWKSH